MCLIKKNKINYSGSVVNLYRFKETFKFKGNLNLSESPKILTLVSRIRAIWQHVVQSRSTFEEQPDKGYIEKCFF
jgi:hypothetical protein